MALLTLVASCSSSHGDLTLDELQAEPILAVQLRGASSGSLAEERGGTDPMVTVLFDVDGDWREVATDLARRVVEAGWMVELVNCVATGHDVIAKRQIAGEWVLLESGAGTRGAGVILRRDPAQQPPQPFRVTGPCTADLVRAAGG